MARWNTASIPSQAGRLAVVTGAGGLGYEVAIALAGAGASIVLAGRNRERGEASLKKIRAAHQAADVRFELLDLADLASVRAFGERLSAQVDHIDLLVNNAGIMMPPQRRTTTDGFELQFGTNFLGHFALTAQLLPLLSRGRGRVVSVSSSADTFARIAFDDLQAQRRYSPETAYSQSKLALSLFTRELQRRSDVHGWHLTALCAQPGLTRTDLLANGIGNPNGIIRFLYRYFGHEPSQGALSVLFPATMPNVAGGDYYGPDGFLRLNGYPKRIGYPSGARDLSVAERLWNVAEELTHVRFRGESLLQTA